MVRPFGWRESTTVDETAGDEVAGDRNTSTSAVGPLSILRVVSSTLWQSGGLDALLAGLVSQFAERIERLPEDEVLARSTDDLVVEYTPLAVVEPLTIGAEPVDGDVTETTVSVAHRFDYDASRVRGYRAHAVFEFTGDRRLFEYTPNHHHLATHHAEIRNGTITIGVDEPGLNVDASQLQPQITQQMGRIREMAGFASAQAADHNRRVEAKVSTIVEDRKARIRKRRDLAGALGFPLQRRSDAPKAVPLTRKKIGSARARPSAGGKPYADELALSNAQYEDAIEVVRATLLAMERSPSVASGKSEEELRDQILVQLNGTFSGGATGETFVQSGKTDILVRASDRHVFVAECKWWSGPSDCSKAVDQLLSYLPWRDEKAALILFIGRKDATAVIEKANEAVRTHPAFKRPGGRSDDPMARRNFVLGHPDDPDREIRVAALFAVLPKT
jgi:hypothetical protein